MIAPLLPSKINVSGGVLIRTRIAKRRVTEVCVEVSISPIRGISDRGRRRGLRMLEGVHHVSVAGGGYQSSRGRRGEVGGVAPTMTPIGGTPARIGRVDISAKVRVDGRAVSDGEHR